MSLKRWITIIAISALIIGGIVYGFIPKPVPVEAAKVSRGGLKVAIAEEGETRVRDRFVISAPVAGYMRRVDLEVGDRIKAGQIVALIEPLRSEPLDPRSRAQAEASIKAAQESLNSAMERGAARKAEFELAAKQLVRNKKLHSDGYISKEALDQAESAARSAEAALLSAQAEVKGAASELERAKATLIYSTGERADKGPISMRSPVNGRVLKIQRESAGVVNPGDAILDIGDPLNMEVKVELLSTDAVKVRPGTPVIFERWGGDAPLEGKVRTIEPAGFTKVSSLGVEEQRVLVIADITSEREKWEKLGDGYSLEARFILWEGKDVLQIPSGALFRHGESWAVFAMEKNKALMRKIEIGRANGLATEILSGLSEGETVIVHPDESIREGTKVYIR